MTSGTCARQRRALTRVLDLEPGTGVGLPPEAAYSCPHASRKEVPRQDWILEPCGHGAEALLDEPLSHVWKSVFGTSSLDREPEKVSASPNGRGSCIWLALTSPRHLKDNYTLQSWDICL